MKERIIKYLNIISGLIKAWPVISFMIALLIAVLLWFRKVLFQVIAAEFPVVVWILIGSLAFYPILKGIEWIFSQLKPKTFLFKDILWRNDWRRWYLPTPLCPQCSRRLVVRVRKPPQIISGREIRRMAESGERLIKYVFDCPLHNEILITEDSPEYLQELAKNYYETK